MYLSVDAMVKEMRRSSQIRFKERESDGASREDGFRSEVLKFFIFYFSILLLF